MQVTYRGFRTNNIHIVYRLLSHYKINTPATYFSAAKDVSVLKRTGSTMLEASWQSLNVTDLSKPSGVELSSDTLYPSNGLLSKSDDPNLYEKLQTQNFHHQLESTWLCMLQLGLCAHCIDNSIVHIQYIFALWGQDYPIVERWNNV